MVGAMSKLVVLEGLDGAGTTTQARRLAAALTADGRRCTSPASRRTGRSAS
jgi:thymidylate kinase